MAIFCDFENVALGVRDTKFQKFDIRPVLERLLLKGSIVVKKAYCDWERYKEFKAPMHEANFELIEIPHVRQSGKNSADIRLVVDALDFCYTKSHVNTFVIISGDSDFSPLVSKLRENNKTVIGVGVKQSTSDLLVANCDEFIFYDDIAREIQHTVDARRGSRNSNSNASPRRSHEEIAALRNEAVDMVVETFEALVAERGDSGKVWASALKSALKRRRPDFNESYYGFRAFGNVLEEAQARGYLEVGRAENSATYVFRSAAKELAPVAPEPLASHYDVPVEEAVPQASARASSESRVRWPRTRGSRGPRREHASVAAEPSVVFESVAEVAVVAEPVSEPTIEIPLEAVAPAKPTRSRRPRSAPKPRVDEKVIHDLVEAMSFPEVVPEPVVEAKASVPDSVADVSSEGTAAPVKRARKTARSSTPRARRPRKTAETGEA